MRRKRGRKRSLDRVIPAGDLLLKLMSDGLSIRKAAAYCGLDPRSVRRAAQSDEQFAQAYGRAKIEAEKKCLNAIMRAIHTDWRSAAWLLERTQYRDYGKRDPDSITPAQLAHVIERLVGVIATKVPPEHINSVLEGINEVRNAFRKEECDDTESTQPEWPDDGADVPAG